MYTESQVKRIAECATNALVKTIRAFPRLITESDTEKAADVLAGILKATLSRPAQESQEDPAAAMRALVAAAEAACAEDDDSLP
jgi:hypothetical protein